ncbi:putative dymeclin [Heterostelium album PN500]|uniref:Dymeclin n=1 Tax=Heterostelium pallidum (strain ATCC 26659 / Pp 5 / PN500) TaxID=670386 RepID=D3B2T8_HETP5|nr:putative dymeclin [Heterostelium album PN500]EFA83636.1 putative dymeclin [Heterostelium album PN500]|eukprot:XP_020435753.1 putative dymeclin [Heterostelium album PN500]
MGIGGSVISTESIAKTVGLSNQMNDELKVLVSQQSIPLEVEQFMETLLLSLNFSESSNHTYLSILLQDLSKQLVSLPSHYLINNNISNQNNNQNNNNNNNHQNIDTKLQIKILNQQQYLINYTILLQSFTRYFIENMVQLDLEDQFCGVDRSYKDLPFDLLTGIVNFLSLESKNLYNNVIYDKPRPSSSSSLFNSIGNAASFLLLIPWSAYRYFFPVDSSSHSGPLSDLSLLTLLSMIQYYYLPINPYRKITHSIQDADFSDLDKNTNISISMSKLYEVILQSPASNKNLLLLYYLLQENPYFFKYVQSRTDIDNLVLPMLQVLYSSFEEKPQQVYMILIIILILSQDTLFNANVHSLVIHQVLWYKERHLVDISLGGLLMVVLIKSIMLNLSKLRDVYLHTNCLAILANLSSNISHIHPYVSSRLVKLLEILSKRYMKLKRSSTQNQSSENLEISLTDINSDELQTHSDFLYIVLQIINNTLTYRATSNPHLIYSLLHQNEYLPGFINDDNLSELSTNILNILSFFTYELSLESSQDWSAEKILLFLETKSKQIAVPPLDQEGILRFKYEEESNSFEFITPYIWSLIYNFMGEKWDTKHLTLFQNKPSDIESTVKDISDKIKSNDLLSDDSNNNSPDFQSTINSI